MGEVEDERLDESCGASQLPCFRGCAFVASCRRREVGTFDGGRRRFEDNHPLAEVGNINVVERSLNLIRVFDV